VGRLGPDMIVACVLIFRVKFFSPDVCCPDVTRNLKLDVPTVVGVPLINQFDPDGLTSDRPAGSEPEPDTTDQLREEVPPVATRSLEYGVPTTPSGRGEFVVIVKP
jgi:hypothetical protein